MTDDGSVLLELERLRRSVDVGFAELKGELRAAVERTGKAEEAIVVLERRVTSLEKWRVGLLAAAPLLGGGGAAGLFQVLGG